jgi:hypothetical protein
LYSLTPTTKFGGTVNNGVLLNASYADAGHDGTDVE